MYLVVEPLTQIYIFTEEDPRQDGYDGPLEQDVRLDETRTVGDATSDSTVAVPCVGRSPHDPKQYAVFQCNKDCRHSGFEPVATVYAKYQHWGEFENE